MHPFRFGIQCRGSADGTGWRAIARKVEDLGWSTLTIADHFDDALAPIPGLMAAADATTTLRVGSLVLANDYRHPVVVAKEAATLDVLTGGRFGHLILRSRLRRGPVRRCPRLRRPHREGRPRPWRRGRRGERAGGCRARRGRAGR